jgi:hypothetical protein
LRDNNGEKDFELTREKYRQYRSAVGILLYLATKSRPDISNATRDLSRFVNAPRRSHWRALIWLCQYLAKTRDYKLRINKLDLTDKVIKIHAFIDSSFASTWDLKSVTGYLIQIGGLVSWGSLLQRHVVSSSTEAEVDAAHDVGLELLWWHGLVKELGYTAKITIHEDNTNCKQYLTSGKTSSRTKHMRVRYYRIVDLIQTYKWSVEYVETKMQLADMLTKNVIAPIHARLLPFVMGWQIPSTVTTST